MKKPENDRAIRVAIADDHALFRAGVKTALSVKKDIELIAEADNGMQLLNLLKHIDVDVILLDIHMPIMDGIQTLPEIRKVKPEAKVIILSMHNDHSMISKLMEIGANSYLTKNTDSENIYNAIKTCYEQEFYFNELTNTALLMEEVGEVARIMARQYGEQSFKKSDTGVNLADEMADVLFLLICLANQTGIDLTEAFEKNMEKKRTRDTDRHRNNEKLK